MSLEAMQSRKQCCYGKETQGMLSLHTWDGLLSFRFLAGDGAREWAAQRGLRVAISAEEAKKVH